jgi:hypothetical protein
VPVRLRLGKVQVLDERAFRSVDKPDFLDLFCSFRFSFLSPMILRRDASTSFRDWKNIWR